MKTTVDIPENLLKAAMRYSGASTKREAVLAALEDFNRRHQQADLIKYLGTLRDFITPEELAQTRGSRERRRS
jgi:Arc/MetJ family transcription regulator